MKKIYLDYAATTPLAKEVFEAMLPYFEKKFGNPGSIHILGQETQAALDNARLAMARFLGTQPEEIIFTGSATESNNLAIRGIIKRQTINDKPRLPAPEHSDGGQGRTPHIITSQIEHESVLETCRDLESRGFTEVSYLGVSKKGIVKVEDVLGAVRENTVLISIHYANNEIGTIQAIAEIGAEVRRLNSMRLAEGQERIHFHTDAVQAAQFLDISPKKLGVDLLTFSSHKIYGPKGLGALYVSDEQTLQPIITGGGQERGLRSGTENVPYIVGFAKAVELVEKSRETESRRIRDLRNELYSGIRKLFPGAKLNGAEEPRLPNNLNLSFPNYAGEELLLLLDGEGVAVSTGSACQAKSAKPSHVLIALGLDEKGANSSLRFSLGRLTTKEEISQTLKVMKKIFLRLNIKEDLSQHV
ncbi:MAG: cysteine desulfurase [Parcubacteria group bacterium]|nr:cysteine desulfurase [Parcubacteria group bacterium]